MDKLYWLPLLKNLRNYMQAAKQRDNPDQLLFGGVNIHIGKGTNATFPYIDLIWTGESNIPKINQGKRTIELWIDCWSKYVGSDTEEFANELYIMQCKVSEILGSWPEYLKTYTFPGGRRIAVVPEIKNLCSDGIIAPPTTASRFIVALSVKEEIHAGAAMFPLREI